MATCEHHCWRLLPPCLTLLCGAADHESPVLGPPPSSFQARLCMVSRLCTLQHPDLQILEALPAVVIEDSPAACRYFEDVAQADVSAILNHHAHMEDIDVSALSALLDSEPLDGAPKTSASPGKKKGSVGCACCQAFALCCLHPMRMSACM